MPLLGKKTKFVSFKTRENLIEKGNTNIQIQFY